jgi:hypothetical protein
VRRSLMYLRLQKSDSSSEPRADEGQYSGRQSERGMDEPPEWSTEAILPCLLFALRLKASDLTWRSSPVLAVRLSTREGRYRNGLVPPGPGNGTTQADCYSGWRSGPPKSGLV